MKWKFKEKINLPTYRFLQDSLKTNLVKKRVKLKDSFINLNIKKMILVHAEPKPADQKIYNY